MSASVKEGLRKIVETFLDEEGYRKKKTTIMDSALQKLRMKGNILHKKVNNEGREYRNDTGKVPRDFNKSLK
jgi:hypothetical protein